MYSQIERQRPVRGADEQIALNQNVGIVNTHHDTYKRKSVYNIQGFAKKSFISLFIGFGLFSK